MNNKFKNYKWGKINNRKKGSIINVTEQDVLEITNSPYIENLTTKKFTSENLILQGEKFPRQIGQLSYNKKEENVKVFNGSGYIILNNGGINLSNVGNEKSIIYSISGKDVKLKTIAVSGNIEIQDNETLLFSISDIPTFKQIIVNYIPENDNEIIRKYDLDRAIMGLSWQEPVLNILNEPPINLSIGDRYLISSTPIGLWSLYSNYIVEWNNQWIYTTPINSMALINENTNKALVYNQIIDKWINIGTLVYHNYLGGLQGGIEGEYYHLSEQQYNNLINQDNQLVISGSPTFQNIYISGITTLNYLNVIGSGTINTLTTTDLTVSGYLNVTGSGIINTLLTTDLTTSSYLNVTGSGTINTLSTIDITTSGYFNATGSGTINTLVVTDLTTSGYLNVTGSGTINTLLTTDLTTSGYLNVTGSGTINTLSTIDLTASGYLNVTGSGTINTLTTTDITTSGYLNVTGSGTINNLVVTDLTVSGNLNIIGSGTINNFTENLMVSGYLNVTGSGTINNLVISGQGALNNTSIIGYGISGMFPEILTIECQIETNSSISQIIRSSNNKAYISGINKNIAYIKYASGSQYYKDAPYLIGTGIIPNTSHDIIVNFINVTASGFEVFTKGSNSIDHKVVIWAIGNRNI